MDNPWQLCWTICPLTLHSQEIYDNQDIFSPENFHSDGSPRMVVLNASWI